LIRTLPRRRAVQLVGLAALTLVLVACSGGTSTTPLPSGAEPPADCARVDGSGVITLSADHSKFSAQCMVANAGEVFTIHFTNNEDQPHNVSLYESSAKATELFRGEVITGPDQSIDYPIDALQAGEYWFDCLVHPEAMNGVLYVVPAGGG
jgi:plastocyanin